MEIVINHLTRMKPGYCCVAGINLENDECARPLPLAGGRMSTNMLRKYGGLFDVASVVNIGNARHEPNKPEVEDYIINPKELSLVRTMESDEFWKLLEKISKNSFGEIFGDDLIGVGRSAAVKPGTGKASLGCMYPSVPPAVRIERYGGEEKIKVALQDEKLSCILPVTDLRFYEDDHKTLRHDVIEYVDKKIKDGVGVIVGLGLARPYQRDGDDARRHWLQLNNFHFEDDPVWQHC